MKNIFVIILFTITLFSCKENIEPEKITKRNNKENINQVIFKNISEVVNDKKSNAWLNSTESNNSLELHFNLDIKDTLSVMYSHECWLFYPYKIKNNKIEVYWDKIIDTKYDFEIVKAINKIGKKHIGKSFMTLELLNDTVLKANYTIPEIVKSINNSDKKRTLFTENYMFKQK